MIDREHFYKNFPFRPLSQKQVDVINFLLDKLDASEVFLYPAEYAYILATIKHETAETYLPISEIGKGAGRVYGKADIKTGKRYYGRGYVQLTWIYNYATMSRKLGVDLINNPDLALQPETAWRILETGMNQGLFTGHKLSDYITSSKRDFYNSRKVINGLDRASLISRYAAAFWKAITD